MKPAEKIERLIKKSRYKASPETYNKALDSFLQAVDEHKRQKSALTEPNIRRIIMKSRITKLAAAAVIIIAVLVVIDNIGPSSVALAEVLDKVKQVPVFMYKLKMQVTGDIVQGRPLGNMDQEATIIISTDLGMKMEMTMTDPNSGEQTIQQIYLLTEQKEMLMIMPKEKKYVSMEITDELLDRMKKQSNDPREMIKQMSNYPYTKLDRSVVDGITVEGFETTDPAVYGGAMGDSISLRLWVDIQTRLPVLVEMDMEFGEKMKIKGEMYDFQWNIQVDESEFAPVIPEDFEPLADGMKMPEMTEEAAIDGLRMFEEFTGKYPEDLSMMTLMEKVSELRNSQSPAAEKFREKLKNAESEEERVTLIMDMMQPIQSIHMFYLLLVEDQKEPAYYGDKVTPEFPHAVLMRWKSEDGNYRVVFGDLTVEDVTPDELAELEAAPLNIKPTAVRPQPVDGGSVAFYDEVRLSWIPGAYVNEHKVYFGTSVDQMLLLAEVADACSVMAPALEKAVTYYWRVDEVQPDGSIAVGDIWSFDTGKLVGFWELDGNTDDSSGNENHGTIFGEPNLVTGKVGGALQFDGFDDSVRTDYATDLPTWTVALWVKSPAAPSSGPPNGLVHRQKNLQINWNHTSEDFQGAAGLSVANQWYAAGFGQLQAETWYHLAATYDGENLKAYTNGVLITDNPDPSGPPDKETATLKFARHANYGDHFKGTIDDVCLYSYDLSADEVAAIYSETEEEK
jgi:hypothetical protein